MTDLDKLAQRLITARSVKGLSQQGLAEASGVAAAQVSRYESGKNFPRPEVVAKLAKALDVGFEWLLSGTGLGPDVRAPLAFYGDPSTVAIPLSADLHRQLSVAAAENGRDLVVEIVRRLESTLERPEREYRMILRELERHRLMNRLGMLEAEVRQLEDRRDEWEEHLNEVRPRDRDGELVDSVEGQLRDMQEKHNDLTYRISEVESQLAALDSPKPGSKRRARE